jgi:hypothetical protein
MAFIHSLLENTFLPTVDEISVESVAIRITMRKYKWLTLVLGLTDVIVPGADIPVTFHEDARERYREFRICASARIWSSREE